MKKRIPFIASFLLLFFISNQLLAQELRVDSIPVKDSVFKEKKVALYLGTAYAWNLHYFGRTDSLQSNAVVPTAILKLGKHLTINPSLVFVSNQATALTYAATIVNGTYNYGKLKGFSGNISVDKYFYKDQSLLVRGAQWGQVGTSVAHNSKVLGAVVAANAAFTKNDIDFFSSAGLNKQFKVVKRKSIYLIQPMATANFGTQNFTNTYYKNTTLPPILPGSSQQVTEDYKKMSLLSYDFSLSLTYVYKKFIFNIAPGYVIPKNILGNNNNPSKPELAKNTFYSNAVIVYKLTK